MTDSNPLSTTTTASTAADSHQKVSNSTSPATPSGTSASPESKQENASWRDKFRARTEERGKERWRDASLNDKDRWKEWQKAKDKEQAKGSTAGFYTDFYRKKGSLGYWLDMFF